MSSAKRKQSKKPKPPQAVQRRSTDLSSSTSGVIKSANNKSPKAKSFKKPRGISRIDQPSKNNHGWFVRVTQSGRTYSKFFSDSKNGGRTKALEQAKQGLEKLRAKYPRVSRRKTAMIARRPNPHGLVGVTKIVKVSASGREYGYWIATWSPRTGYVAKKMFSVRIYGEQKAKELAIKARRRGVREMED